MGRTVEDCASLLDVIAGRDENDPATWLIPKKNYHYKDAVNLSVKGMKVGIMYLSDAPYQDEENAILKDAKEILSGAGIEVIDLSVPEDKIDDYLCLKHEFRHDIDYYLSTVRGHTKMTCLEDIIRFNEEDPKVRMPYGQSILTAAAQLSGTLTESEYFHARKKALEEAYELSRLMEKHSLDAIISPRRTSHAPVAGNPCISVPSKPLTDLTPRSLIFIGRHWDEERLIAISHTYENLTHYRIPPVLDR
jgi:amidase